MSFRTRSRGVHACTSVGGSPFGNRSPPSERGAEIELLEPVFSEQPDGGRITGNDDRARVPEGGQLVREPRDVDRTVAREVVVVDERDVHAATR